VDCLASMYIDNEMNIDEKVAFVDRVHSDRPFYQDTRALLLQEKVLRMPADASMLPKQPPAVGTRYRFRRLLPPAVYAVAGFAAAVLMLINLVAGPAPTQSTNRFVIYEPAARQVELTGTFTGWRRMPMASIGNSGYWEVKLQVPSGEHRFAYILDGSRQMADPTLPIREKDDFGGENSILNVGERV